MSNPTLRFKSANGLNFPDTVSCTLSDISKYSKGTIERKNCLFIGNEQLVSNFGGATLEFRTEAKGTEFNNSDILFGNIRPYLKKVWLSDQSGIASPDVLIFKVTDSIPGYLKCILSSERFFNHVAQGYKGSKMPRGDKHQIMDFRIQCPCLEEQQKIASFFSTLDQKIELNERKIEALEKLKKGVMQQLFSKKKRFLNENEDEFPLWDKTTVQEVASVGDIDHKMPKSVDSGIPYLMTGDLFQKDGINWDCVKQISEEDYEILSSKFKPEQNDTVIARYASVGAVKFIEFNKKFLVSYSCAILKPKTKIFPKFLYYCLSSNNVQSQIKKMINSGTQANIGIKDINKIGIDFPVMAEQVKISNVLSSIDKKIEIERQKTTCLKKLKNGFMQQMFV